MRWLVVGIGALALLVAAVAHHAVTRDWIVVISIDTLRADHLGAYGYARPTSPNIDALARDGTLCSDVTSTAPWTLPAHVSLFSSLDVRRHQVRLPTQGLRRGSATLAPVLAAAGYRTIAVTNGGYVGAEYGFDDGFDEFHELVGDQPGATRRAFRQAWERLRAHRFARRLFLFLHVYQVHMPYGDAEEEQRFVTARPDGMPEVFDYELAARWLRGGDAAAPSELERRWVVDLYDGGIAVVDRHVGELVRHLRSLPFGDRLTVVVTSDHGEELFERHPALTGEHGHTLQQGVLSIPLVIWPRSRTGLPSRIERPVGLIDVAPTVVALAGVEPPGSWQGSRLDLLVVDRSEPQYLAGAVLFGPERRALRAGRLKYIVSDDPTELAMREPRSDLFLERSLTPLPAEQLYDLAQDPAERVDLATVPSRRVDRERLESALDALVSSRHGSGLAVPIERSAERVEQLRALGYLD